MLSKLKHLLDFSYTESSDEIFKEPKQHFITYMLYAAGGSMRSWIRLQSIAYLLQTEGVDFGIDFRPHKLWGPMGDEFRNALLMLENLGYIEIPGTRTVLMFGDDEYKITKAGSRVAKRISKSIDIETNDKIKYIVRKWKDAPRGEVVAAAAYG